MPKNDKVISYVQALLSEFKQLISSYVQKKRTQLALKADGNDPLRGYFKLEKQRKKKCKKKA